MQLRRHVIIFSLLVALIAALLIQNSPLVRSQAPAAQRIESDDPSVIRAGSWTSQAANQASGGSYLYSSGADTDVLTLQFSGPSIEVIFVAGPSLATLAINVDDSVLRTVITTADQTAYEQSSRIDYLSDEPHTLKVYAQAGGVVGVDAFVAAIPVIRQMEGEQVGPRAPCTNDPVQRVSVATGGAQGNSTDTYLIELDTLGISDDGRFIVFSSDATNLVPNDTNNAIDVFVHDRQNCETIRVSVSNSGQQANSYSYAPQISGNGRYVVFYSEASNLTMEGQRGSFIYDLQTHQIRRLPHSCAWGISTDGRYVLCRSTLDSQLYVLDRQTDEMELASQSNDGQPADDSMFQWALSANGNVVIFSSTATNLVEGTSGRVDLYARDMTTDITTRVSVTSAGDGVPDTVSEGPFISADGHYAVFSHWNDGLVPTDNNGHADVFIHDRQSGETSLVSVNSDEQLANGSSGLPFPYLGTSISVDGHYVAFPSSANNLISNDTNGVSDVFVRDLQLGTTRRVSLSATGGQANARVRVSKISGNGRYVVFATVASNLVGDDTNGGVDVFVMDSSGFFGGSDLLVTALDDGRIQLNWADNASDEAEYRIERSLDGLNNWLEIDTAPANTTAFTDVSLICGTTYHYRVRAYRASDTMYSAYSNIATATACPTPCDLSEPTSRVSIASDGTQGNGSVDGLPAPISADGRYVAFGSYASNLVSNDTNNDLDVFVHDRDTCQTIRVSVTTDGTQANSESSVPAMSSDGRYIVFRSFASNLVAGDTNGQWDIFLHDRTTGITSRVSVASDGSQADYSSYSPRISSDGRYIAFQSVATNLVSGDTNGVGDIFVHDRTTGITSRISVASDGSQVNGESYEPIISADGNTILFASYASNLVSNDTNSFVDAFVHDRTTGITSRVSVASDGSQANDSSRPDAISADGRYVVFGSLASNLVNGDTSGELDRFLHDRTTGITTRLSVSTDGLQGNAASYGGAISPDGRYVWFASDASNLVSYDNNEVTDVFVYDQTAGTIALVSYGVNDVISNGDNFYPSISENGRYLTFFSFASNLVNGDTNGMEDIFVRDLLAPLTPPSQPSTLSTTTIWQSGVNLSWADNSPSETEYRIERSSDGISNWAQIGTAPANGNTYSNIGLNCNTAYHYRVRAYRAWDTVYSSYTNVADAATVTCLPDALALVNPATRSGNLIHTLTNPPAGGDYTQFATGLPYGTGGQYVMGDWNGDGLDTIGVYWNGAFFFTNDFGTGGTWGGIWFGLGGQAVVGRFDATVNHDCLGVTDSGTWTNGDAFFVLYFTCNLTSGPTPPLTFQWLSILLPNSQGFTGTFQFVAGDFNGDGVDSVAVRRGAFIAWTNVPPTTLHSQFNLAQYIGAPGTGDEGKVVAGDWDLNNVDSFGLVYQNGTFYRRNDVEWNTGVYLLQTFTPLVGTPFDVASWRPN